MNGKGATLENTFFQSNVPGRYTSWTEDGHHAVSDGFEKGEDEQPWSFNAEDCIMDMRCPPNRHGDRFGSKTGPKGVLADYKAHAKAMQDLKREENEHRQYVLFRIADGGTSKSKTRIESSSWPNILDSKDEDSPSINAGDDDFVELQRMRWLADMKQLSVQQAAVRPRILFGEVEETSGTDMVDKIDALLESSPTTKVVVHVYEPHLPACRLLNSFLPYLARNYPAVCFLRLHQGLNLPRSNLRLDAAALPMLLVYEKGEVQECVARVDACLGAAFLCEDVEGLLEEKGVLG